MRMLTLAALVFLVGCGPSERGDKAELYVEGKYAVKSVLKDPGSADFSNTRIDLKTKTVCGDGNAKNSFGGYVGAEPFIYTGGRVYLQSSSSDEYNFHVSKCFSAEPY